MRSASASPSRVDETTADLCRLAVEETRADVERAVVVEHADFGALGRRLAFVGIDAA